MKALLLFGPLFLAGCSAMPAQEGALVDRCDGDVPEIERRRDPVKRASDRIRLINLGEHCKLRSFRLQCEWVWGR